MLGLKSSLKKSQKTKTTKNDDDDDDNDDIKYMMSIHKLTSHF